MSRALTRLCCFALVLLLAGCASQAPVPAPGPQAQLARAPVLEWLQWQASVATMEPAELKAALEGIPDPASAGQRFYYGLLRQQANDYNSWVSARDNFRQLQAEESLTPEQRQLAGILERYNQSRINWFHSREELQQQYRALQEQNRLLEQKIQAITDLESTISTRKEE